MSNYLIRRGGRYSYRRRYPTAVAQILGRSEFVQALGTADKAEAARLARRVSVQFDDACAKALAKAAESTLAIPEQLNNIQASRFDSEAAAAVLTSLPDVMRAITLSVLSEQSRNPRGWRDDVAWRKKALLAQANGEMPTAIQMHPAQALAALKALEAVEAGQPMDVLEKPSEPPQKKTMVEAAPDTCRNFLSLRADKSCTILSNDYLISRTI